MRVRGQWKYLYRAVDKEGNTVDLLLTAKRDRKAAVRFLRKAIGQNGVPAKITIDKSGGQRRGDSELQLSNRTQRLSSGRSSTSTTSSNRTIERSSVK